MVFIILLDKILEDAPGLEYSDHLAILERICDGGDSSIRIYLQKPGLLLDVGGDVEMLYFVRETQFFKKNGDLDAIGRRICVERDVWSLGVGHGGCWCYGLYVADLLL